MKAVRIRYSLTNRIVFTVVLLLGLAYVLRVLTFDDPLLAGGILVVVAGAVVWNLYLVHAPLLVFDGQGLAFRNWQLSYRPLRVPWGEIEAAHVVRLLNTPAEVELELAHEETLVKQLSPLGRLSLRLLRAVRWHGWHVPLRGLDRPAEEVLALIADGVKRHGGRVMERQLG